MEDSSTFHNTKRSPSSRSPKLRIDDDGFGPNGLQESKSFRVLMKVSREKEEKI